MFDINAQFVIKIMSGDLKRATCRFPTDQEWCERARQQKGIRRAVGRGESVYDPGDLTAIDQALFEKIFFDTVDPSDLPFDAADASSFIRRLERCEITDVDRSGDQFRISMRVAGANVVHILGIPAQRDVAVFGRDSVKVKDIRRGQEIRVALEPSGKLWDVVARGTEGYAGAVPIIHKDVALVELLAQIAAIEDDSNPET